MSHELRTPLNSIIILLNLAKQALAIPKTFHEKFILPALHSSEYLLCLINDILDYNLLEYKKEPRMTWVPTSIQTIIEKVIFIMKQKILMRDV